MAIVSTLPTKFRLFVSGFAIDWRVLALACFTAWVLVVGSHHEPWFDEAQSWLLARDNSLWTLLADRLRYEGSPGLWHVVLWFAIRAGLPYSQIHLIPAAFAVAGVAVVLWRAPFPALLRVGLLASYFFGYQLSVLARSYCMELLLVPLAACCFADRVERPLRYVILIGLLGNTNTYSLAAAGVMGLELTWQIWRAGQLFQARYASALLVGAAMGLFAVWTVWQPHDNSVWGTEKWPNPLSTGVIYLLYTFVDRIAVWRAAPTSGTEYIFAIAVLIVVLTPVVRLILAGGNRMLSLGIFTVLICLWCFVYADTWQAAVLFLFWLFLMWINWDTPISSKLRHQLITAMAVIFVFQAVQTLQSGWWDIGHSYSPGQPAAKALQDYRERHPRAVIHGYTYKIFEMQPWLAGNPFANYHHGDKSPSYTTWNRHELYGQTNSLTDWQRELAANADLIVASSGLKIAEPEPLEPLACQMGYGLIQSFPGTVIWRGRPLLDNTIYLFERGAPGNCARLAHHTQK